MIRSEIEDEIFVSIPSYRDPEVAATIRDCWAKAVRPGRVIVGVCQQIAAGDLDVRRLWPSHPNLRVDTLDYTKAQGPCYARQRIEERLLGDEDFVLGIDAHTVFCKGWDELLINDWKACDDPKAILTTYPKAYQQKGKAKRGWTEEAAGSFLTTHSWKKNGLPLFALHSYASKPPRPVPSIGWVAGFSFAPRQAIREVPYLVKVPYLFIGEEIAMAVRFFTAGYNLYAPTFCAVQTTYLHTGKHKFEELKFNRALRHQAEGFVRTLIGISMGSLDKYPSPSRLGDIRTLDEFESYSGIKLSRSIFTNNAMAGVTTVDDEEDSKAKWASREAREAFIGRRYFQK
jgi:hypothetical protein